MDEATDSRAVEPVPDWLPRLDAVPEPVALPAAAALLTVVDAVEDGSSFDGLVLLDRFADRCAGLLGGRTRRERGRWREGLLALASPLTWAPYDGDMPAVVPEAPAGERLVEDASWMRLADRLVLAEELRSALRSVTGRAAAREAVWSRLAGIEAGSGLLRRSRERARRLARRSRSGASTGRRRGVSAARDETRLALVDPFSLSEKDRRRSLRSHARLRNVVARHLTGSGVPRRPPVPAVEPLFDLAWLQGGERTVGILKTLDDHNEERQLRSGLARALRHRQWFSASGEVVQAALVVGREPLDSGWWRLCDRVEIALAWPGQLDRLLD